MPQPGKSTRRGSGQPKTVASGPCERWQLVYLHSGILFHDHTLTQTTLNATLLVTHSEEGRAGLEQERLSNDFNFCLILVSMFCSTGSEKDIRLHFFFFFWKKSILDLSSCSAKTIRNLENSTSIRVDLVSLQTRKPKWSPRSFSKLPKSHRWKILDQTADALTLVKPGSAICAGHQLTNLAHILRAAKVSFGTSLWNTQGHQGSPGICSVMNRKRGKKPCREEKKA